MKIGYIIGAFPTLSESFVLNEIIELIDRGHEVHVFSILPPKEDLHHKEVDEYNLLSKTCYLSNPCKKLNQAKLFLKAVKNIGCWSKKAENVKVKVLGIAAADHFSRIARKLDIDILHAHFANLPAFVAMLISSFTKIPFTFTAHAFDIFVDPYVEALRERMKCASAVITPSYFNKNYLHDLIGISKKKIHVVRACPIIDKFKGVKRNEEDFTITTVGRLVEKKGVKYGILAVKELVKEYPEIRYRVIGSGPLENELKGLVRSLDLGKNVEFLGNLDDNSLIEELSKTTVFILPCVKSKNGDMDGIPVSLMEAMYLRTPVISTKISGIPELVENGKEGILMEPRNGKQLANAIKTLIENKNLRTKMGRNGRKKIEIEFNIHKEIKKLIDIWENCRGQKFA